MTASLEKTFRITRNLLIITASLALTVFLVTALFVRPLGDDYCISARLVYSNPVQAALIKYLSTSNRFSNQLVASFSDLFGARGVAVLSAVSILLWCSGLWLLLREIAKTLNFSWDKWNGVLITELLTLFAFYSAPNIYQSVYWRPGVMTYFLPLALFLFIFSAILHTVRNPQPAPRRTLALLGIGAFFIGGLSETAGAFHISILSLSWLATYLWNKNESRRATLNVLLTTALSAVAALAVMFLAPGNAIRVEESASPGPLTVIVRAFTYSYQFLVSSFANYPLPLALAFGISLMLIFLGIRFNHFPATRPHPRAWLGLLILPALTYFITVVTFAPSAYGQSFPIERVRFPAHILLILMLLLEGGLVSWLLAQINFPRWGVAISTLAFALMALYPLRIASNTLPMAFELLGRAHDWERRNESIMRQAADGKQNIVVVQLPGYANVKDLDSNAKHWVNRCAAYYYGVETIRATNEQIPGP